MSIKRSLRWVVLLAASLSAMPGQTSAGKEEGGYWLIKETTGKWKSRLGDKIADVSGGYHYLPHSSEVRCVEKDEKTQNCSLVYVIDPSSATGFETLTGKPSTRWTSLRSLKAKPPLPVLSQTPDELVDQFQTTADRGGSRSGSLCGGDLVLRAPVCGEAVDVSGFRIRWLAGADSHNKSISFVLERVDGAPKRYRGTAAADSGEYADPEMLEYLKRQQSRNDPVDIAVRVMAGGRSAVRLVRIPPAARMERYESRVRETDTWDPFCRRLRRMALAMQEDMWSKAAEEARELMDLAPGAPELREYAAAGLCQSDFEEQKAVLRTELPVQRYNRICTRPGSSAATPESPVAPVAAAVTRAPSGPRLGIALLIGNWDYWNVPLASVKSDLREMSAVLAGLGFQVVVRENLKTPQQFEETLADVLKKENATPDDVLLVYYSGHGLQIDGKAHLLGTGASSSARVAEDVRGNAQSAEELLAEMERSAPGTRILIVEACRDNVFSAPAALGGQAPRAGFAFQQDDVPNTVVMFSNRPGMPTPVRSDYGLMGPFTESFVYSLNLSPGDIQDVYTVAAKKTAEISPGQEPVMYTSKRMDRIVLRQKDEKVRANRAVELLNAAAALYRDRAWDQFLATVDRAKALALDAALQQRLSQEGEFVRLVQSASESDQKRDWKAAASSWERAYSIFPGRQWLAMRAAVAWLMADEPRDSLRTLSVLSADKASPFAAQAGRILKELLSEFPDWAADVKTRPEGAAKLPAEEFELVQVKE